MVSINADDAELVLEDVTHDVAEEAANRWFSTSNERLLQLGDDLEYDVYPVAQAARPPRWDSGEGAFVMDWPHRASVYFEHGTTQHEVEGDPVLAFEWEEMRGEEFGDTGRTFEEVFDEFPTVFLPTVNVEGIPSLRFVQKGRREAVRWLNREGLSR